MGGLGRGGRGRLSRMAARCETVLAAGLSMGGSLAIKLAQAHPDIAGIVLINPLVDPPASSFRDMLSGMLEEGVVSVPAIGSDIAMSRPEELSYDASPIEPMLSMFEGVDELAAGLGRLTCPVLLFSSRTDHVVPTRVGRPARRFGSRASRADLARAELPRRHIGPRRAGDRRACRRFCPQVGETASERRGKAHLARGRPPRGASRPARPRRGRGRPLRPAAVGPLGARRGRAPLDTADVPPTAHPFPVGTCCAPTTRRRASTVSACSPRHRWPKQPIPGSPHHGEAP